MRRLFERIIDEARRLDVEAMTGAAALFVGEHDWTAFSAAQSDVKTRVRNVTALEVTQRTSARGRGRLVEIRASAEGFLRYMVRSIAGTLLAAGRGEVDDELIRRAAEYDLTRTLRAYVNLFHEELTQAG